MDEQTDDVIKNYRKALKRVVEDQDSHLDEMPDDATLHIIDEAFYTYSSGIDEEVGRELEKLEDRIDKLEKLLKSHFHRENGDIAQQVTQ